jgi:hypothetical protein
MYPKSGSLPSRVRSGNDGLARTIDRPGCSPIKSNSGVPLPLVRDRAAAPSFNGRTADSGSAYRGSNPWGAANIHAGFPIADYSGAGLFGR